MGDDRQLEQLGEPLSLARRLDGVVLGALVGFGEDAVPLVDFPGNPHDNPLPAQTTAILSEDDIGRDVALLFERGDPTKPVLIGPIVDARQRMPQKLSVQRDGDLIELTAEREIVLRCGNASITLTCAGKVLIRGAYVSSYSTGVNAVKGGAVHIN